MLFGLGIPLLGVDSLDTLTGIVALFVIRKNVEKPNVHYRVLIKEVVVYQYNEILCDHQK